MTLPPMPPRSTPGAVSIRPMSELLELRPDLAHVAVAWLLAQRIECLSIYGCETNQNRIRRQRTRARSALAVAAALRTDAGLHWHLVSETLHGRVDGVGALHVSVITHGRVDRDILLTNIMRRLTDPYSAWIA